jgi:hypothetical protein
MKENGGRRLQTAERIEIEMEDQVKGNEGR